MSRIIDNGDLTLAEALRETLPHANAFDACVGYFNLRGWQLLRHEIGAMAPPPEDRPAVRLIVGMAIPPHEFVRRSIEGGFPRTDSSAAQAAASRAVEGFVEQLTWGTPTKTDRDGLRQLRDDLRNGMLKVRFAAREPLHAKLYLTHSPLGASVVRSGIVGSSNLTSAGLARQGELSLEETDKQTAQQLADWFDERWDDRFTIDITAELIEVLDQSWVNEEQPDPYLVYLRLAYELSRDAREGRDNSDVPAELRKVLLPHQVSAVQVAAQMLKRRGIAVIGDVVGLGKTLTGTAIAASTGDPVLVIAPKNLGPMWEDHLHEYGVPGKVLSLSMATRELPTLRRYRLVLIDESHNLRNAHGKAWEAIREYVEDNDSKVVLLTATMYNARHSDIGGQLALKLPPDEPLGLRPQRLIDAVGEDAVAKKTNGRLDTLAAFSQSEDNEDWQRLLSLFLVRRTRKFLEDTYGTEDPATGVVTLTFPDGNTFRFPIRVPKPLRYKGGNADPNDRLATTETFDAVSTLAFARHQLGNYLVKGVKPQDDEEAELLKELERSTNSAAGFIRTMALKRLTSSAHAFMLTVLRMIARNYVLDYAITQGLPVPLGNFGDQHFEDIDDDGDPNADDEIGAAAWGIGWTVEQWHTYAKGAYEAVWGKRPKGLRWARTPLFRTKELLADVRADTAILQDIADTYGRWNPKDDTKLQALAKLIDGLGVDEKILVFTEYKDTVDYIVEHLPGMMTSGREVASASGQSADAVSAARRFAPRANAALGGVPGGSSEVDILITTDVLSEGQNLQDSAIVVNWDLPWTIIKMIQRAGRIDRVGQRAPEIDVMSFLPNDGVEQVIGLRRRLLDRLRNNAQMFGGGERFFDDDDFAEGELAGLFDGSANLTEDEGEVDASSYAMSIWDAASEAEQGAALALNSLASSTKSIAAHLTPSVITYGRTSGDAEIDLLVRTALDSAPAFMTPIEALDDSFAVATERASEQLDDHLELVAGAQTAMQVQASQNTVLLNHGVRRRLYKFLLSQEADLFRTPDERTEARALIDALTTNPLRDSAQRDVDRILRSLKVHEDDGSALERIANLHRQGQLIHVRDTSEDRVQIITSMGLRPALSEEL